jgi:hypothetical protein
MDWKNIDRTKTFRRVIVGIIIILSVVIVFEVGVFVGFRKALFSGHLGDNYYRAFGSHRPQMINMEADDLPASFGAAGKIVKVNLPEIIIADRDNVEKTILITNDTIIKQFRGDASTSDILQNDFAVVIGSPNDKSQIEAKLIRILPPPIEATSTAK